MKYYDIAVTQTLFLTYNIKVYGEVQAMKNAFNLNYAISEHEAVKL